MPGTAVTKSVVANDPGGRRREEIFVDIIEKISVTFSSSVSNYFFLVYYIKSTYISPGMLSSSCHIKPFISVDQSYVLCPNICSCILMLVLLMKLSILF